MWRTYGCAQNIVQKITHNMKIFSIRVIKEFIRNRERGVIRVVTKIILGWLVIVSLVSLVLVLRFPNERRLILVIYIIVVLQAFKNLS